MKDSISRGSLQGSMVLVTGASAGIGKELAREAASLGCHLVLVARRRDRLSALADDLSSEFGVDVLIESADLSVPGAGKHLAETLLESGIHIDILINNAGFGIPAGYFHDADMEEVRRMIDLMVTAPVELAHALLPTMKKKSPGVIVNVASTAAFQPVPFISVYSAAKAFMLSFGESLWAENRNSGVQVLTVCPGTTLTEFFDAGGPRVSGGRTQSAKEVAEVTFRNIGKRGKPTLVTSLLNHALSLFPRLLTRGRTVRVMEEVGRSAI
ncbi:SDR family NAD(P)-dependent oxidoreductase [Streptomyces sp. SID5770]|uniref:SDR family NAD(P)-dependent oxidoreductase n=1 Tax=Streptomyces sp. SID5770 TaxID=2690308 RepID=UPI00136CDEEF|nr:SDR family oxidoreductase [Streptomyces sp. SID5770]MZE52587.1 SDR family NAD(P)-dependent oxidoreductase [Streptomyces sp. SID5770]